MTATNDLARISTRLFEKSKDTGDTELFELARDLALVQTDPSHFQRSMKVVALGGRRWRTEDRKDMLQRYENGEKVEALADRFGRTISAVMAQISAHSA